MLKRHWTKIVNFDTFITKRWKHNYKPTHMFNVLYMEQWSLDLYELCCCSSEESSCSYSLRNWYSPSIDCGVLQAGVSWRWSLLLAQVSVICSHTDSCGSTDCNLASFTPYQSTSSTHPHKHTFRYRYKVPQTYAVFLTQCISWIYIVAQVHLPACHTGRLAHCFIASDWGIRFYLFVARSPGLLYKFGADICCDKREMNKYINRINRIFR